MKRLALATIGVMFGLGVLWSCASMQTWPDNERSAENKMGVIQATIGDGLKTGALTPDQSQNYLTQLKALRADYAELRDKSVYRERWDTLLGRLDRLETEINRTVARAPRREEPRSEDRIVTLQRTIDEGRRAGRLPLAEGREYQARLDAIRSDASRMTDGGRSTTYEARADISHRLDSLERDLNR
jgi:hypothetical protein